MEDLEHLEPWMCGHVAHADEAAMATRGSVRFGDQGRSTTNANNVLATAEVDGDNRTSAVRECPGARGCHAQAHEDATAGFEHQVL